MKRISQVLQRMCDAMVFANVGNLREFENLLREEKEKEENGDRRKVRETRVATLDSGGGAVSCPRRRAPATMVALSLNEVLPG